MTDQEDRDRAEDAATIASLRLKLIASERRSAALELALRDALAERGESWLFEVAREREAVHAYLHQAEMGGREECVECGEDCGDAHDIDCRLAKMLRAVGGEEEHKKQAATAHDEAVREEARREVRARLPFTTGMDAQRWLEDQLIAQASRPTLFSHHEVGYGIPPRPPLPVGVALDDSTPNADGTHTVTLEIGMAAAHRLLLERGNAVNVAAREMATTPGVIALTATTEPFARGVVLRAFGPGGVLMETRDVSAAEERAKDEP